MDSSINQSTANDDQFITAQEAAGIAGQHLGIPHGLLESLQAEEENNFDGQGGNGRLRLPEEAARRYGINSDDALENIAGSAKYLRDNYEALRPLTSDDRHAWMAAAVAHNRGLEAVKGMIQSGEFVPSGQNPDSGRNTLTSASKIAGRWADIHEQMNGGIKALPQSFPQVENFSAAPAEPGKLAPAAALPLTVPQTVSGFEDTASFQSLPPERFAGEANQPSENGNDTAPRTNSLEELKARREQAQRDFDAARNSYNRPKARQLREQMRQLDDLIRQAQEARRNRVLTARNSDFTGSAGDSSQINQTGSNFTVNAPLTPEQLQTAGGTDSSDLDNYQKQVEQYRKHLAEWEKQQAGFRAKKLNSRMQPSQKPPIDLPAGVAPLNTGNVNARIEIYDRVPRFYSLKPSAEQVFNDSLDHTYGKNIFAVLKAYKQQTGDDLLTRLGSLQADIDAGWNPKTGRKVDIGGPIYTKVKDLIAAFESGGPQELQAKIFQQTGKSLEAKKPETDEQNGAQQSPGERAQAAADLAEEKRRLYDPTLWERMKDAASTGINPLNGIFTSGQKAYDYFQGTDNTNVTDREIDNRLEQVNKGRLSPEQQAEAEAAGQNLNFLQRGFYHSLGRLDRTAAGFIRPFSSLPYGDDLYKYLAQRAGQQDLAAETNKNDAWYAQLGEFAGALPIDLLRIGALSRLPGGAVIGLSLDNALQTSGAGRSFNEIKREGEKGGLLGLSFGAGKLAGEFSSKFLPMTETVAKLGTIGTASTGIELAYGAPLDKAVQSGALNVAFEAVGAYGPKVIGKVGRVWIKGEPVDIVIDPNGDVSQTKFKAGADPGAVDYEIADQESQNQGNASAKNADSAGSIKEPISGENQSPDTANAALELIINRNTELTGKADDIQNATIGRIKANPRKFIDEYLRTQAHDYYEDGTKSGYVIGSDRAKPLFPEYEGNRLENDAAVYPAASAVSRAAGKELLKTLPKGALVQVTAGGPGSGKSSIIKSTGAGLVYDSVMGSKQGNRQMIDDIVASGHHGILTFVYRPVENAVVGNMKRAFTEGRLVSGRNIAGGHFNALNTFLDDTMEYAKSKGFDVRIFRTVEGKPSEEMSVEDLRKVRYNSIEEVQERAERAFDEEFKREKYPESFRRVFKSNLRQ